jgi:hypothetical protein
LLDWCVDSIKGTWNTSVKKKKKTATCLCLKYHEQSTVEANVGRRSITLPIRGQAACTGTLFVTALLALLVFFWEGWYKWLHLELDILPLLSPNKLFLWRYDPTINQSINLSSGPLRQVFWWSVWSLVGGGGG